MCRAPRTGDTLFNHLHLGSHDNNPRMYICHLFGSVVYCCVFLTRSQHNSSLSLDRHTNSDVFLSVLKIAKAGDQSEIKQHS